MESDAVGLAPLQVLLHAAGLLHEGLEVVEARVGTAHHRVELRDGDHLNHLCSGERCMMCLCRKFKVLHAWLTVCTSGPDCCVCQEMRP